MTKRSPACRNPLKAMCGTGSVMPMGWRRFQVSKISASQRTCWVACRYLLGIAASGETGGRCQLWSTGLSPMFIIIGLDSDFLGLGIDLSRRGGEFLLGFFAQWFRLG